MNRNQSHQADMEFVDIPGTSIRASRVALGTWAIGGWMWGGSNESDAVNAIHTALDRGINLIDTAPVYGFGRSEEIVGKALAADGRRKRAYIATKVGLDWKDGKPFRNAGKARIIKEAVVCRPTSSISTRSTGRTRTRRSRKSPAPWTSCTAPGKSAPSA
jgi:hypothetical protein